MNARTHTNTVDALHDAYLRAIARNALRAAEERARNRSHAIGRLKELVAEDGRRKERAR